MVRGEALRSPDWAPVLQPLLGNKRLSNGLASFANWCVTQDASPSEVDDKTVQRFSSWLEARTLCLRPHDVVRQVPKLWNEAREKFEPWPRHKLTPLSFRGPRHRRSWEQLSESFRTDADAYLKMRANPDLFDERPSAPTRPLAESTLRQQSEHLRLAASVLVDGGISVEDINWTPPKTRF